MRPTCAWCRHVLSRDDLKRVSDQELAGNALRNRQHAVDALGDLCEAVKLVAVIVVEEAGGRRYEELLKELKP